MAKEFNIIDILARWIFALLLVLGTYNPTQYSYISWFFAETTEFGPVVALVGIGLLIAWIVFLRATFMALGWLGIILAGAFFGCFVWLMVDLGWLSLEASGAMAWVTLVLMSLVLAIGLSWGHIRRGLTGQYTVDDVDD